MKKLMIIIFMSVFIFISSYSPVWAEGWGKTNWGMNIPEVENATKGKVILLGEKLGGELYSHKLQNNVTIVKHNFDVFFNFASNKLDNVMLKTDGDDSYAAYLYLLDELKKKYGSPSAGPKEKKMSSGIMHMTEWVTNDTVIQLNYVFMALGSMKVDTTNIHYSPRQSSSSGNL